jgi:hypothetical protein
MNDMDEAANGTTLTDELVHSNHRMYDYLYHHIDRNAGDTSLCNFSCAPSLDSPAGHVPISGNDSMLPYIAESVDMDNFCSTVARCVSSNLL